MGRTGYSNLNRWSTGIRASRSLSLSCTGAAQQPAAASRACVAIARAGAVGANLYPRPDACMPDAVCIYYPTVSPRVLNHRIDSSAPAATARSAS